MAGRYNSASSDQRYRSLNEREKFPMAPEVAPIATAFGQNLASFLRLGVGIVAATVGADGRSEPARGWGLIPQPDERTLTIFIPAAHAGRTLANLETSRQIAVTCGLPTTYEAYQLKGQILGTRPGREGDRPVVEMYREAFLTETTAIGFTEEYRHAQYWPVVALVMSVEQVFRQTPGAGAGELIGGGA